MRITEKRNVFLSTLNIQEKSLVWQEQTHGDGIHIVDPSDRGKSISGVDGLVWKQEIASSSRPHNDKSDSIVLSVHTADCIPLLACDPIAKVIGVAHAGWKGTVHHIGKKLIQEMVVQGSQAKDIRVAIGPSVCGFCYPVDINRAEIFRKEFIHHKDIVKARGDRVFVDIGKANYIDFTAYGVEPEHIDFDCSLCTFCKTDEFYSFRRSGKPLDGEILGVIGFR